MNIEAVVDFREDIPLNNGTACVVRDFQIWAPFAVSALLSYKRQAKDFERCNEKRRRTKERRSLPVLVAVVMLEIMI